MSCDRDITSVMSSTNVASLVIAVLASWSIVKCEVAEAEVQQLSITPTGTQTKAIGASLVLTCNFSVLTSGDHTGQPVIRWRGPDMEYISDTQGRVHIEPQDAMSVRLYVTHVTTNDTGMYSCESDYGGELLFRQTELFIYEGIQFANTPIYVEQKVGGHTILPCAATGTPSPEISWRFSGKRITMDGVKYTLAKESSLRINDIHRTDNGTYECRAEVDSFGQLMIRKIDLKVLFAPVLIETPQVSQVVKGMQIELRCVADGSPSVKYEWIKEQKISDVAKVKVPLAAQDPNIFVISSMDTSDEGRYVCRVSNKLGTREAFVDISMLVRPELRNLPPEKRTVEGGVLTAACDGTGRPEPIVFWSRDGSDGPLVDGSQPDDPDVHIERIQMTSCRLVIRNVRLSHGGKYTCSAKNDIGTDTRTMHLIVEYQPSITDETPEPTGDRQYGWPNQIRRFTCSAKGLPHPALTWVRNSQPVANNEFYRVTTMTSGESGEDVTTSVLEMTIGTKQHWLYGNYTCIAKNSRGHTKKVFRLQEAELPEPPGNVTVVEETATSVTLHVGELPALQTSTAVTSSRPAVTSWLIEYKQESVNDTDQNWRSVVFDNDGKSTLTVIRLTPDTTYTFHLSAGSVVGYSPKISFRVRTHGQQSDAGKEQSDGPARGRTRAAGDDSEALPGYSNALEKHNAASVVGNEESGSSRAGMYAGVVIGIMAALAVGVALSVGAMIRLRGRPSAGTAWWHTDMLCCDSNNLPVKDGINKTLKTPPTAVVRRTGTRRLDRLMFWKRRSNPTPLTEQQAGAGWPTNDDMDSSSHAVFDSNAQLQTTSTVPDRLVGRTDVVNDSSSATGLPERSRVDSPLMSSGQQQLQHAPGTPPRTVYRSPSVASSNTGRTTPQMSSPQAWKCLKSPPFSSAGEAPVASGTAASISGPTHLLSASSTDNFPEREWQLKKFLEAPQESFGSEDDRSYNDILDGYHSEDNIDDTEDNDNYTVAVRKP